MTTAQDPSSVADAPGAWPLLGHLSVLRSSPLKFLTSLPSHGDLVRVRLGPVRAYVLCRPDLVHEMLRDPATFDKGGRLFDKSRQITGNGLLTCRRAEHLRQRPLVQPAFTRSQLASYVPVMHDEVASLTGSWEVGRPIDISTEMIRLFARITARTLFHCHLDDQAVMVFQRALTILTEGVYRRITSLGLWEKLPTAGNRRYRQAERDLHSAIDQFIDRFIGQGRNGDATGDRPAGILGMLLAVREGEDSLTRQEVHDQTLIFLMAGIETTAATLSWTLHLLGRHPQAQERMHTEITTVLGPRLPTLNDIPRLDYTRRVLTESLRLYPPAWILTRTATTDTHLGGHPIPAGTTLLFSPYLIHHDARFFPDPDHFIPDRCPGEHPSALIPFGGGPRKCIGDVYGITEALIALAGISTRWRLTATPGPPPRLLARGTLTPHRLIMTAQPR
ncbi:MULTISPECIES: cytochrome P450 [unclassified Streptomyces]|uniref:cytochrome P450 n=1 Tax=unclassified Streptomyces TaxID=2593676 RepID=UPI0013A6B9B6|nr:MULTISPECIES: cytochrome P450 [unclassified Streptomyces]